VKILHVMGGQEGYGVGRYVAEHSRAQARLGHSVHVLTAGGRTGDPERVNDGVLWHAPQGKYPFFAYNDCLQTVLHNLPLADRLRELVEREGPFDVVSAHGWKGVLAAGIGQRVFRCPLVVTLHGTQVGRMGGKGSREEIYVADMEKWACERAERVVVPSRFVRREVQDRYGISEEKIALVPGGVGQETFEARVDAGDFREVFASPDERLVLLAGRLAHEKGPDLLLRSAQHALKAAPNTRFILAGDGPMKELVEGEIEKLGLGDRVRLTGLLGPTVMGALYRVVDLVVVPSRYEAFGIGALEAVAWGVPVLAANVGGLTELAEKVGASVIHPVNPEEPVGFASAIVGALKAQGRRTDAPPRAYGQRGIPNELTWREAATQSIEVYEKARVERECAAPCST